MTLSHLAKARSCIGLVLVGTLGIARETVVGPPSRRIGGEPSQLGTNTRITVEGAEPNARRATNRPARREGSSMVELVESLLKRGCQRFDVVDYA